MIDKVCVSNKPTLVEDDDSGILVLSIFIVLITLAVIIVAIINFFYKRNLFKG